MKTRIHMAAVLAVLGLACAAARAADVPAPLLEEDTFAVARVRLGEVDTAAIHGKILEMIGEKPQSEVGMDLAGGLTLIGGMAGQLRGAGVEELYFVFNAADLPYFVMAAPNTSSEAVAAVAAVAAVVNQVAALAPTGRLESRAVGGMQVVGRVETLERLKSLRAVARPEFAAALSASPGGAVEAAFCPPAYARRVLLEMLPALPELDEPATVLTEGVRWASARVGLPRSGAQGAAGEGFSLAATIQSQDAAAAGKLEGLIKKAYGMILERTPARKVAPGIDKILAALTPRVAGDRLVLQLEAEQIDTLVAPALAQATEESRRAARMTQLKQIGMALVLYRTDHGDVFPADLAELVKSERLPNKFVQEGRYVYRAGDLPVKAAPLAILAYEKAAGDGGRRGVLFLDGHVEALDEAGFAKAIAADNQERKKLGVAEKPAE